ncbi:hypothetical protein LCGC14_2668690 [marine sediment metagenome]|uniref:Uncharacterized protein n=1 Tax=marine sediment metagenome TaxID=412755 RepID=A0A0F8ZPU7_9ZZZZ
MADQIRAVRETLPVAGVGGFLTAAWPLTRDAQLEDKGQSPFVDESFEVSEWRLRHLYINVEIPMSGNFGAMTVRRVAEGFEFVALAPFDRTPLGRQGSFQDFAPEGTPFMDARLQSLKEVNYDFMLTLNIGDASEYLPNRPESIGRLQNPLGFGAYYFCDSVKLEEVTLVNLTGDKPGIVRWFIRGVGSSPLRRYHDTEYHGAGSFGFTAAEMGFE